MSELLIKLPDEQMPFFLALLERLNFVEVEQINGKSLTKTEFLVSFEESLMEAKLHLAGKLRLPKIEDVLNGI
jgi:hypothetical protein